MVTLTATLTGTPTTIPNLLSLSSADESNINYRQNKYYYIYATGDYTLLGTNAASSAVTVNATNPLVLKNWNDFLDCQFSGAGVTLNIIIQ